MPPGAEHADLYFHIQRVASLVRDAASPGIPGFDAAPRLRQELRRAMAAIPAAAVPPELAEALAGGAAVGQDAARWLPSIQAWLQAECRRTGD